MNGSSISVHPACIRRPVCCEGRYDNWRIPGSNPGQGQSHIPLPNTDGTTTTILSIVKPMNEVKEHKRNFLRSIIISATILTLLFIALYAFLLYMGIIRPILFLTYETSHLAEHHGELTGLLKKIRHRNEHRQCLAAPQRLDQPGSFRTFT